MRKEARAHVHPGGAERKGSGQPAAVRDTARREHGDRSDRVDHLGNQRHGAHARGHPLPARFAPLRDHHIDAERCRLARLGDGVHLVDHLRPGRVRALHRAPRVAEREKDTAAGRASSVA